VKTKGSVVALGTFDGVHRGHKKVIESAVKFSNKAKLPCLAITFDPHPQQFIAPQRGLKLLTTLAERKQLFCGLGVDRVAVFRFNQQLQKLSYENFVKQYLVGKLKAKKVFVGFDYAFGKNRQGNIQHLKSLGKKYGFEVRVVLPVFHGMRPVKSSCIREHVSAGKFNQAIEMLGHAYPITGYVVKGHGIGKKLGFPTANLKVDQNKLIPAHGVYCAICNGKKAAVNIGDRPTFGPGKTQIEVHIIGFTGRLKSKALQIHLVKRLRDEIQFSDVNKLKQQICLDIKKVVNSFSA
jgi:riboflavin kinase/FMN adenylyltransferase